jgi:hypothetical protein
MEQKDHFDKTFWYTVGCTFFGLLYVFLITFTPIPKENVRFADTALGFFLGTLIANCVNYLTGGNPGPQKKQPQDSTTTTASIEVEQTKS